MLSEVNPNTTRIHCPERISDKILKATAPSTAAPVTKLFNICISTGIFPTNWKLSSFVPVPKSQSDKGNPKNYRPISLLPIPSKLLEKHICSLLTNHFQSLEPIHESQFVFQERKIDNYFSSEKHSQLVATAREW